MGYSSVNAGKPARIVPVGLPACMLIRSLSHPHLGPPNPGPGPSPGPSASALELVVLQQAPTNDHPLDLRSALADEQHGSLAVEPLDLVLLGVAVAAVDPERVLDVLRAVFAGEVLRHARLEVVAGAGVLELGGLDHHLVGGLGTGGHLSQAEEYALVLGDLLAEGLALLGVLDAELEGPQPHPARTRGDVDAADLDAVHHLVEALAGDAAEDLAGRRPVVLQNEFGGVDALVAHLLDLAGHGQSGSGLAEARLLVAQEGRHVLVDAGAAEVGLDEDRDEIGRAAVGEPHLLAVDDPVLGVALPDGLGADRRNV